jgi:hypothetical protein
MSKLRDRHSLPTVEIIAAVLIAPAWALAHHSVLSVLTPEFRS